MSGEPQLRYGANGPAVLTAKKWVAAWLKSHGKPLAAKQIALSSAYFGGGLLAAVKAVQKASRLRVDGVIGPQTWAVIRPRVVSKRDAILAQCHWALAHEPEIHYAQVRPMPLKAWASHSLPLYTDCSGSTTCIYHAAGAPDPNGKGYSGAGFTGTILSSAHQHDLVVDRKQAQPGDLVVFGDAPGTHVVILMQPGSAADPMVFSHGQESGPKMYPLSVEQAAHKGQPLTWISAGV